MTMKICRAFAVATAVVSTVCTSPSEAFAPPLTAPQQQGVAGIPDELMLKHNPLASSSSLSKKPTYVHQESDLPSSSSPISSSTSSGVLSSSTTATFSTNNNTPINTSTKKIKNSHTKMQRAHAHSRVAVTQKMNKKNSSTKQQQRAPLLTKEEEGQYAYDIRLFRAAAKLRDQLVRYENGVYIHPTEAEWAAAFGTSVMTLQKVLSKGQEARTALIAGNAGLVIAIAKKHYAGLKYATEAGGGVGTILSLQDMIQEGNLGLMEAAERFEPEKGFRFSTYATWWVRQRIGQSISDSSRTIRLPAHVHGQLQKIRKARTDMQRETGREPSHEELAHYMEISEEKLRLYTESSRNVVSLERPVGSSFFSHKGEQDRRTLGDTLASDAPTPVEDAEVDSMRRDIRAVLDTELAGTERDVLVHRFGLNGGPQRSIAETASTLGISVDRVRAAEARALNKLRHPQRNYKLKEYIQHEPQSTTDRLEETFANSPTQSNPDRMWFF